jgi:malonyl-CoA decarboxylase
MSGAGLAESGLFDRALRRVASVWRDVAQAVARTPPATGLAGEMAECLAAKGGEVSARTRAEALAGRYRAADAEGRAEFLRALASFDADPEGVRAAMERVADAADAAQRAAAKARLRRALEPPRMRLLTQFTTLPDGMKFLVDLRAELLPLAAEDPWLAALETDLRGLLANWFDVGMLELRRIDWHSAASLLEKLVQYEAVHRIRTWRDLKNRLDSDRRCYGFFHPRMPGEPLIFVEVALTEGLAASVQALLDEKAPVQDPATADAAVFYSINNCQRGLDGIAFGNFLIKRVVADLSAEFSNLTTFATLSPMPGFRAWLAEEGAALLSAEEAEALGGAAAFDAWLADRHPLAHPLAAKAEPLLPRLAARYLVAASGRNPKRARDPVAHFHLANGARVERINRRGDVSEKGVREGLGLMVNYLYDPAQIEANHEAYAGEGKRAASAAVKRLAKG